MQFAKERLSKLLPMVPVVFALALEPIPDPADLPPNVTGRIAPLSFAATIAMARRLQPDAERIVIVGGLDIRDSLVVGKALADLQKAVTAYQNAQASASASASPTG